MNDCKTPVTVFDLSNPQVLLAWQRNHLANERTFLAWCRTGLALFAFGFVIERFDFFIRQMQSLPLFEGLTRKHLHTEAISMTTFVVGVLVIVMAGWRFAYVRRLINRGEQRFSALPDTLFMLAIMAIIISLFGAFWLLVAR